MPDLLILSGPSGAGKSTLCKRFLAHEPRSMLSVSCTTRERRQGEVDGVHYHYLTQDEFLRRRDADEFAEYASVHGNWYGTLKSEIDRGIDDGNTVVFDIDYQGAQQLQEAYPDAVSIMILPPDLVVLEARLRGRATDTEEVIQRRMSKARHEIHQAERFDYVILNEDLEQAFNALVASIAAAPFLSRRAWPWVRDRY